MDNAPLLERTKSLLVSTNEPLRDIAIATDLGYEWLKKLKKGSIPDPSVRRIQRLHDYLDSVTRQRA